VAQDKKSFLLYCDFVHSFRQMPDEFAGKLIKHIFEYVNDTDPQTDDFTLIMAFEPIKQQLKRDLKKYKKLVDRNKANGSKGGRPTKPKKPTGLSGNPLKPKKADIDTVTVTGTVKDINISFDTFWILYDKKVGVKNNIEKKWNKLKPDERKEIIEHLPLYKLSQPDKKYRKNPETYINQKSWNDELIQSTGISVVKDRSQYSKHDQALIDATEHSKFHPRNIKPDGSS